MLIIMRGCAGSGKSFLAKQIASLIDNSEIHSSDNYFLDKDGVYRFDAARLGYVHKKNQEEVVKCVDAGYTAIVDNTNTTWKEIKDYTEIAKFHGLFTCFIEPSNPWSFDVEECTKRNTHAVPRESIQRMLDRWHSKEHVVEQFKTHYGYIPSYMKLCFS